MEKLLADVLRILREEIDLYRDLAEHARQKTALLVSGHMDAILESNKTDETYSLKLRILEDELSRLCGELCQAFKIPCEEFTLLKLAEGVSQSVAVEIRAQTSLFKNLIAELKSINHRNTMLIESSVRSRIMDSTSRPTYPTSVNFDASTFTNGALASRESLLAISVFPTPVGPIIMIFFGRTSSFSSGESLCLRHLFLMAIATAFFALF